MNAKKTSGANLETKKSIFFKIGLCLAMVAVLFAFEYRAFERVVPDDHQGPVWTSDQDVIQITIPKPPPPPPPKQEIVTAPDDKVTDEEFRPISSEVPENYSLPEFFPDDLTKPEVEVDENNLFDHAEIMPEFPGGLAALYEYLGRRINYPRIARELDIHGTVYVGFIVEKDGSVTGVNVLRGIGGGCDEEAMRVIRDMPRWKPGQMGLKPVRVRFSMPVRFILESRK